MYKEFYGLLEDPFTISPNPKFLYLSQNHREGISHLLYGIEMKKSPIVLTGDMGTGKTTLLYTLIEKLDKRTRVAFLVNSQLNINEILQHILYDFGLEIHNKSKGELLLDLKKFLKSCGESGEDVIVILDEAQNFSASIFEELRLLTNIETASEKLIQLILVGQLGLEEKLQLPELAQLRQRVGVHYRLLPISYHEVKDYIETRLAIAGATGPIFTTEAVEAIYAFSKGIPRVMNVMCDLALFFGYADKKPTINRTIIRQVQDSLQFNEPTESTDDSPRTQRHNEVTDAIIIRQARGRLSQEPSQGSENLPRAELPDTPPANRRFARLGFTALAVCVGLLGLIGGSLAWEHRENITALIARWSQSLQQRFMLEQSSTQAIEPSPMRHVEVTMASSAQGSSKSQEINNYMTKNSGALVTNKGKDPDDGSAPGSLSSTRKQDTVLEKSSPSDIREQLQDLKVIIVQSGDTLSKIIINEYGQYDKNTLELVVKANPSMLDIDLLEIGQRIALPKFSKSTANN